MSKASYSLIRKIKYIVITEIDLNKLNGFRFKPGNRIDYFGIKVDKFLMVNSDFIEKVLKRKIKKRLELYLRFIISIIDSEEGSVDGSQLRAALSDLDRYRDIIKYKYQKYLDEKYLTLLLKKMDLLEQELKTKIYYYKEPAKTFDEEYDLENNRSR